LENTKKMFIFVRTMQSSSISFYFLTGMYIRHM